MRYRDRIDAPLRRRALARFALSLSDEQYRAHHARLASGDVDDRHDGLFIAVVRRDVAAVERALDDGELLGRALSAAIRLPVSDTALRRLALSAPFVIRRQVYRVLRRSCRRELAESLLPQVPARDRPLLLAACSPGVVERWLPALRLTADDLHRLARVAPVAVARRFVEDAGTDPARRWSQDRHTMETALRRDPAAAAIVSPDRQWHEIGTPDAVAAALRDRTWWWFPVPSQGLIRLPRRARRTVRRLAGADLDALARLTDGAGRAALLDALPPARRRPLPGPSVVELMALSFAGRVAWARTLLAERPGDPEVLALLPYAEVRDTLLAMTRSHRADERERGWLALLRSAMLDRDPAANTDAIDRAGRAWTDQHLVQQSVLSLLAAGPARSVTAVPVPAVAAVVHTVLTRPDVAPRSWQYIDEWLTRTLTVALDAAHRPDAGPAEVARAAELFLVYARTKRDLGPWYAAPRLRPRVRATVWDLAHDLDGRALLVVAAQLGLDLGDRMRDIALGATDPEIAREAARLWVGGAPADRAERLQTLLEHDPALARVPEITRLLTTRHTSLLDHAAVRSLRPLIPATAATLRAWRPAQRTWYRDAAAEQATDPSVAPADRIAALRVLDDPELLSALAEADDGGVATAALGALARRPHGLAHLAEHVDDPIGYRARAAARALRSALDTVTDAAAAGALTATLRGGGRLAPAKEAVRALGALGTPAAVAALIDAWRLPDLHRDVRAAVAATLVPSVEATDGVAELLAAALRPDAQPDAVRDAILATPVERVPADRRPAVARLLVRALDSGDPAVVTGYRRWFRYAPEGLDAVARMVGLDHPDELAGAARVTLGAALGTSAGDLAWAAAVDVLAAQADRDRVKVRRRLADLAATLTLGSWHIPPAARRPATRALERGLVPFDLPSVRVLLLTRLALGDLAEPSSEAGPDLALWDRLLDAVDDRPHRFDVESWRGLPRLTDPTHLAAVLDHLARRPGPAAALVWIRLAATQERWPEPRLRRLDDLRRHADPDVRETALDVSASG
ncbi:hypothetical protein [Dactylosporangium cerinum]|uniref:hypothetical protein n=1 Tax=Dactylosporangium cerinum TaxID=1434730 RepID=UPI0036D28839